MPTITDQDVAAYHLKWAGHLPDWVAVPLLDGQGRKCSVCGLMAGSIKSWSAHPDWKKAHRG